MMQEFELVFKPLPETLNGEQFQPLVDFTNSANQLATLLEREYKELQVGNIFALKPLLNQKLDLIEQNHTASEQIIDATFWLKLPNEGKDHYKIQLGMLTHLMERNMSRLELSAKGNRQILELYFESAKGSPFCYNDRGRWQKNAMQPSIGLQHVV